MIIDFRRTSRGEESLVDTKKLVRSNEVRVRVASCFDVGVVGAERTGSDAVFVIKMQRLPNQLVILLLDLVRAR